MQANTVSSRLFQSKHTNYNHIPSRLGLNKSKPIALQSTSNNKFRTHVNDENVDNTNFTPNT